MEYASVQSQKNSDVVHYGRLGMKWYRHIYASGNKSLSKKKAELSNYYHKGASRMLSIENKGNNYISKSNKYRRKAERTTNFNREQRYNKKADKLENKANKQFNKSRKIATKLIRVYGDMPVSYFKKSDVNFVQKRIEDPSNDYTNYIISRYVADLMMYGIDKI